MPEFTLFRIRSSYKEQALILQFTPEQVIEHILNSSELVELRKNSRWRVGKPRELDNNSYYFKFGRHIKENKGKFKDGDFTDEPEENARYTHVFLEGQYGVMAIAKNTNLSPNTETIAHRLRDYLNKCPFTIQHNLIFTIDSIKDPSDFIQRVKNAYAVTRFTFTFTKPNPFDRSPIVGFNQEYAKEVNGNGVNTVHGDSLNQDVIESVTNSVASTGDDASAKIAETQGAKGLWIYLKKTPPLVINIIEESLQLPKSVLDHIMLIYRKNRNRVDEG